jgi:hypothetical protein
MNTATRVTLHLSAGALLAALGVVQGLVQDHWAPTFLFLSLALGNIFLGVYVRTGRVASSRTASAVLVAILGPGALAASIASDKLWIRIPLAAVAVFAFGYAVFYFHRRHAELPS